MTMTRAVDRWTGVVCGDDPSSVCWTGVVCGDDPSSVRWTGVVCGDDPTPDGQRKWCPGMAPRQR